MRNYLKYQSPAIQFVVFMGLSAGLYFINLYISYNFFRTGTQALLNPSQTITPEALVQVRWAQLISSVIIFILPAYLYAYLSDERPLRYLGAKRNIRPIILLAVLFLWPAIQPFAMYMAQLNQEVNFGPSQKSLQDLEHAYETVMNNFVKMNTPMDLLVNLFVVALVPAVSEELFFRASLQNILERWTRSPWVAIVISSFAFAFLHLTVFKFLGILTLGLALGTLFYITRNILYNIFFHCLNNSLSLLVTYYSSRSVMLSKLSDDQVKTNVAVALFSLLVTILIFVFIRRKSPYEPLPGPTTPIHFDFDKE